MTAAPLVAHPPRFDLWPEALRSAERLRGSLVPCGPGVRGIGWPETPRVRTAALAPWLGGGRIATHLTAAWVWGAARSPGRPLQVTARSGRRSYGVDSEWLRVYELRYTEADTHRFGEFGVTTPLRTVIDMLHGDAPFTAVERIACRLLCCGWVEGGTATIASSLHAHQRPRRRLAFARLSSLG